MREINIERDGERKRERDEDRTQPPIALIVAFTPPPHSLLHPPHNHANYSLRISRNRMRDKMASHIQRREILTDVTLLWDDRGLCG